MRTPKLEARNSKLALTSFAFLFSIFVVSPPVSGGETKVEPAGQLKPCAGLETLRTNGAATGWDCEADAAYRDEANVFTLAQLIQLGAGAIALELENPNTPADQSFQDSPKLCHTGVYDSDPTAGVTRAELQACWILDMTAVTPTGLLSLDVGATTGALVIDNTGRVGYGVAAGVDGDVFSVLFDQNASTEMVVANPNVGTGVSAGYEARNAGTASDGIRMMAVGTGATTSGGFIQDGGAISAEANLSGGLSLITRASAPIRFYTAGHTNEQVQISVLGDLHLLAQNELRLYDADSSAFFAMKDKATRTTNLSLTFDPETNCSAQTNGGKLTINASNAIICSGDTGGAGTSWDALTNGGDAATTYVSDADAERITINDQFARGAANPFFRVFQSVGDVTADYNLVQVDAADVQLTSLLKIDHTGDADANLIVDSGSTAAQDSCIFLQDRGTSEWSWCKDLNNDLVAVDQTVGITRMGFAGSGVTIFRPGAAASDILFESSGSTVRARITGDAPSLFVGADETAGISQAAASRLQVIGDIESDAADPADTGFVRLGNAEQICWEASPAATDVCIEVDAAEVFRVTGASLTLDQGADENANLIIDSGSTVAQQSCVVLRSLGLNKWNYCKDTSDAFVFNDLVASVVRLGLVASGDTFIRPGAAASDIKFENSASSARRFQVLGDQDSIAVGPNEDTCLTRSAAGILDLSNCAGAGTGVLNVETGLRINGAAAAGNYLRGNGTNYVASAIQHADLPAADTTEQWSYTFFDLVSDLPATLDIPSIVPNRARAVTLTEVYCEIDAGSASINLQRDDGTPANILSADLACSTAGATSTGFVAGESAIAVGHNIDHVTVSVGAGLRRLNVAIKYTVD